MTEQSAAPDDQASPVDRHVGLRLRTLRKARGVTQEELAAALGLTFQQVQKYEKGVNRVSASKLYAAAGFLHVAVSDFFDGLTQAPSAEGVDPEVVRALSVDPALAQAVAALSNLEGSRRRHLAYELIAVLAAG